MEVKSTLHTHHVLGWSSPVHSNFFNPYEIWGLELYDYAIRNLTLEARWMMTDEIQIKPSTLEKFLTEIVRLEKRYAHNERGARNERRSKVVEIIEETAARELDKA